MDTLLAIFLFTQAVGAVIGAGGAVVGELFYFRAIRDGRIDTAEREQMLVVAMVLRWGMIILLVSSIALVLINFIFITPTQPAFTSPYWSEMLVALVVIAASWKLSKGTVKHWLGSGIVFAGWWFLALLTLGRVPSLDFGASLAVFVVGAAIIATILAYLRSLYPRGD